MANRGHQRHPPPRTHPILNPYLVHIYRINYFENYIYLAPTGESELTIRGAFPVYQFEQIKAWLNGWDFEADIHLTKNFDFEFGTSILRAKNQTDNEFLWGMPSDEVKASLSYSPNIGKHFKK